MTRAAIARYCYAIGRKENKAIPLVRSEVAVEKNRKSFYFFSRRAHYIIFFRAKRIVAIAVARLWSPALRSDSQRYVKFWTGL